MLILNIIVAVFLLIVSIIDIKVKKIPSVFLTGILFVVAFLNPSNFWFGIMGFIMAYLLYELDFFSGVADIKILTMIAFMIGSVNWFFLFVILTMVYGIIWKFLVKKLKVVKKKEKEFAFIPTFFYVFLTLWALGGLK